MGLIDPLLDAATLTQQIVDFPSESGAEAPLADAVEAALRAVPLLQVDRDGDAVVARTNLGRGRRVLLAGHLDTVPIAGNLPSARVNGRITGCGTTDMKAALAVMLRLATIRPTRISPSCSTTTRKSRPPAMA
jgi:succinyl-diaminopimelate desuccinylase